MSIRVQEKASSLIHQLDGQKRQIIPGRVPLLAIEPVLTTDLFCIEWRISVGWDVEKSNQLGFCHWIEHSALGLASSKWPDPRANTEWLASKGVQVNAETSPSDTSVSLAGFEDDMETVASMLWHWFAEPVFEERHVQSEREAIIEELKTRLDDWTQVNMVMSQDRGTPGVRSPWDEMDVIADAPTAELVNFRKKWYHPSLVVVCVAGRNVIERFQNLWPTLTSQVAPKLSPSVVPVTTFSTRSSGANSSSNSSSSRSKAEVQRGDANGLIVKVIPDKTPGATCKILFEIPMPDISLFDANRAGARALAFILGRTDLSSRLLKHLRTNLRCVYWVSSNLNLHPCYRQYSSLQVRTECSPDKRDLVVKELNRVLRDLATRQGQPSRQELESFQNQIFLQGLQTASDQTCGRFTYGYCQALVFKSVQWTPSEDLDKCLGLTLKQLVKMAYDYFNPSRVFWVLVQEPPVAVTGF